VGVFYCRQKGGKGEEGKRLFIIVVLFSFWSSGGGKGERSTSLLKKVKGEWYSFCMIGEGVKLEQTNEERETGQKRGVYSLRSP